MFGVVVWSNRVREQAVIWCDDHAALAYLVGREHFSHKTAWPEPGDLLELEAEVHGELRCARSVRPLGDSSVPHLPRALESRASLCAPHLKVVGGDPAPRPPVQIMPGPQRAAG